MSCRQEPDINQCVVDTARVAWLLSLVAALLVPSARAQNADSHEEFFEARIRPILIEHCFECHGSKKQESGLRLDSRRAILVGGDSGPAADVQNVRASLIVAAIRQTGDLKMPPEARLSPQQMSDIEKWISLGLPWPEDHQPDSDHATGPDAAAHWAFQRVSHPAPPELDDDSWAQTDIDRFIVHQLQQKGLVPAEKAVPHVLIRRATLDLLGLPPTPEDVAACEAACEQDFHRAWNDLISRLLDSPHYGERQARYWLDVARYADNKGYVFFEEKNFPWAWTYRDWVIDAFNEDMPYDEFLQLQLAADHLAADDSRSLAAMGYLTLGPRFMNNTHDIIDDRIDVVTRGLMGLTVTCARCHDHKFDPIPQADYYSLYAIFRSSREPTLRPLLRDPPDSSEYRDFARGLSERTQKLEHFIESQRLQMMTGSRKRAAEYLLAAHRKRNHPPTENFMLLTDKGAINPAMLHRWEVWLKRARRRQDPVWFAWFQFSDLPDDEFTHRAADVHARILAISDDRKINPLVREALRDSAPTAMQDVAQVYHRLLAETDAAWQQHKQVHPDAIQLDNPAAEAVRQVLYGRGAPPMVPADLGWGFLDLLADRPTQGEFRKLLGDVEKFAQTGPAAPPRAMVLEDAQTLWDPVIFLRGNPNREGPSVERRFLSVLSPPKSAPFKMGSGRLELARAVVAPENPLTARVFVNRIWKQHFGTGLVETASDFGMRSLPPSHPRLLDWLASEFVASGWSVKHLHRLIMTSAVYQQTADRTVSDQRRAMRIDDANRLLWKFPRRRLDFETIRDAHLAVAGALDPAQGGPPVNVLEGYNGRRTLYGFVNRMDLPGLMRTFDFPEPAATSPGRETTTVPQQALFFLNHAFVRQSAERVLARKDVANLKTAEERIRHIYRLLFARLPDAAELDLAVRFVRQNEPEIPATAWRYGYGEVSDEKQRVSSFAELRHWTGRRIQAGPALPDPKLGWVFHDRTGGHPASSKDRSWILRWISPIEAVVEISGRLTHRPEEGNGVRARIVNSKTGLLGTWRADSSEAETLVGPTPVDIGTTIDFVVDWQGHITHDEFEWPVTVRLIPADGQNPPAKQEWSSAAEFRQQSTDPWTDYVQALLMTSEFVFPE